MLTKADDYPIHQTPEPIAYAGTDRNFYDRYFFNGYAPDGSAFFALALGVYPQLNIMDAAFAVIVDGVQHNLHASRVLHLERMATQVGPIGVEVVEPLQVLRLRVADQEHGIAAELTFTGRAAAIEEPRFTYRIGPRTLLDYTRLTQNGTYTGFIEVKGKRIAVGEGWRGTRDRSWGVRPVGAADSQSVAPPRPPQFYWLWAPMNFDDRIALYHINADAGGKPWNTHAVIAPAGEGDALHMESCRSQVTFKTGTRHARFAEIAMTDPDGGRWQAELTPRFQFSMSGVGYMNPVWGHGQFKGELATAYDCFALAEIDETAPIHLHVQAYCDVTLRGPDGARRQGAGVLEQLIIGPHAPSGFKDLFDGAAG